MSNAEVPAKTINNRVEENRRLKGFFSDSPPRVTICIDHIDGEAELETVFAHELTHLVDYLRGNEMETREDLLLSYDLLVYSSVASFTRPTMQNVTTRLL